MQASGRHAQTTEARYVPMVGVSIERLTKQDKEGHCDALNRCSAGRHDVQHDTLPWLTYMHSTMRLACRELEERAWRARPVRGSKTDHVEATLLNPSGPFGITDLERRCPNVSRDLIRRVMVRWRDSREPHGTSYRRVCFVVSDSTGRPPLSGLNRTGSRLSFLRTSNGIRTPLHQRFADALAPKSRNGHSGVRSKPW